MRTLLITGPVGVGKTTVAEAVAADLAAFGRPVAVVDLDWLSNCRPAPADDPFQLELQLRNLRAVARNYAKAGTQRLVLAGVVESRADRERYAEAVGGELKVCRLKADLSVIHERLVARHHDEAELRWHLNRADELETLFASSSIEDFVTDANRPVEYVSLEVALEWKLSEPVLHGSSASD
ncbi:AAA family ATPase [Lentzea sp. NPDC092896]|uniref:AAA family ATPase n=1 Tax=Lentzea sp. NPDC092896 TaxID=3364127 RepID=UPI0038032FA4